MHNVSLRDSNASHLSASTTVSGIGCNLSAASSSHIIGLDASGNGHKCSLEIIDVTSYKQVRLLKQWFNLRDREFAIHCLAEQYNVYASFAVNLL